MIAASQIALEIYLIAQLYLCICHVVSFLLASERGVFFRREEWAAAAQSD